MTTDKWVQVNATLIQDIGAEAWLQQVVNVLEGKGTVDTPINPYNVINIDPHFAVEHEPIIPRDEWIKANAMLMPQRGIERWLRIFLDILEGDIPLSEREVRCKKLAESLIEAELLFDQGQDKEAWPLLSACHAGLLGDNLTPVGSVRTNTVIY